MYLTCLIWMERSSRFPRRSKISHNKFWSDISNLSKVPIFTLLFYCFRLKQLNEVDRLRNLREKSRNALESFVTDMQHKLYAEYETMVSDEERESIGKTCTEVCIIEL